MAKGGMVVVGAGQAGATMAETLRKEGYGGPITVIGAEPHLPYQRPPLSKAYLLGQMELERLFLRPESYYESENITLRLGSRVDSIDPVAHSLRLGSGEELGYERLGLVTGSRAIHLPEAIGGGLGGVYTVRDLADVDAMAAEFEPGRRVLIVGGGYIGLEAAAVAASKGLKPVLVEREKRILARVAAPETSAYFRDLHTSQGVEIMENTGLEALEGEGRAQRARLSSGAVLEVDFVIIGIGIRPETGLAEAAGLAIENGIKADAFGRTSDPDIFTAGDCASFPYRGRRIRLESVPHAIDMAEVSAKNMLGQAVEYQARPWFWSDQYDVKLQIAGLNTSYDRVIARDGAREGSKSFWYYRGLELLAVDAMKDPKAYMMGKRWIEAGASPTPEDIEAIEDLKAISAA